MPITSDNNGTKLNDLVERSEFVQEVMHTPPHWMIRWGITGVLISTLVLVGISWWVKYPDRIPGNVVITTPQPPLSVIARSDGHLVQLQVKDHQWVTSGMLLAVISSPADHIDVANLKSLLDTIDTNGRYSENISWLYIPDLFEKSYQLGELQEAYANVQQRKEDYLLYLQLIPQDRERKAIAEQIQEHQLLLHKKEQHKRLLNRKVQLARKDYQRNIQLHNSQTIADKALEENEQQLITQQESYQILEQEISHSRIKMAELRREWEKVSSQKTESEERYRLALLAALDHLRSQIKIWEEKHLLIATRTGFVSFFDFWSEGQFVQKGEEVFIIVPEETQEIIGKVTISTLNAGKITVGQAAHVYLDNYPYEEHGILKGVVSDISALPKNGQYALTIHFPNKLITQYNISIPFQHQLQGTVEIITEDLRLIERLFYHFRSLWRPKKVAI